MGVKKIKFPGEWQGFARWLIMALEVQSDHGNKVAEEFIAESRRRYEITSHEVASVRDMLGLKAVDHG